MRYYFENIENLSAVCCELAKLHALCDIVCEYADEAVDDAAVKDNNTHFALHIIHDFAAALSDKVDFLAENEAAKAKE